MKRKTGRPRMKELPGWEAACQKALQAKQRMPAGHYVTYIGPGVLRTVGNFIAPESINRVTVRLIVCMGLGVEAFRHDKEEPPPCNIIDFRKARSRLRGGLIEFDKNEPATWHLIQSGGPYPVSYAMDAHRTIKDEDGGAT